LPPQRQQLAALEGARTIEAIPYDPTFHAEGTLAANGACSWHGATYPNEPVVSFKDNSGDRQSGCERAVRELVERGELVRPAL